MGRIGEYAPLTDPESKPNHRPHNSDETRVTNPNSSTNGNAGQPAISLPVLGQKADGHDARPAIRRSKMGPRRAAVLILIHLAIAAHIIHWKIAGRTLSPVEPSEAMQTLNNGLVNAGFIFFVLAILSTLIVGRYFCGWGCHVVALQDLCAWMLKKVGIRPAPFHSRLLMFAPLALALYMFVWPSLKRLIAPPIANLSPTLGAWLGPVARIPDEGLTNHILTNDFWATFASVPVAIPFLLVCGFATVYFLGAKGFCTYGCPYGGFFAPVDLAAPGRIVVDLNKCEGCGHCTAVCTSNVRVHEEIREYGMVVNPGCMKCMDCVSVCPNDALSFGFRKPALAKGKPRNKRPRPRFDTTPAQDLLLATVFIAVFLGSRGQYGVIPMLMAMGLASIASFLAFKCMQLVSKRDVRVVRMQVKRKGRITPSGIGFIAITSLFAALAAHSLLLNQYKWRAGAIFNQLLPNTTALTATLGADTPAETATKARRAASLYEKTLAFRAGGLGLLENQTSRLRASVLRLQAGEPERAESLIAPLASDPRAPSDVVLYSARLLQALNRNQEALALLRSRVASQPQDWECRELWASALIRSNPASARQVAEEAASALASGKIRPVNTKARARTTLTLGMAEQFLGNTDKAADHIRKAAEIDPTDRVCLEQFARVLLSKGDLPGVYRAFDDAAAAGAKPVDVAMAQMSVGIDVFRFISRDEGLSMIRKGVQRSPDRDEVRHLADQIRAGLGVNVHP